MNFVIKLHGMVGLTREEHQSDDRKHQSPM
jgi:hypothetical protein